MHSLESLREIRAMNYFLYHRLSGSGVHRNCHTNYERNNLETRAGLRVKIEFNFKTREMSITELMSAV